MIRKSFINP